VHKKSWVVHFKTDLFDFKTVTMPPDPICLEEYVEKNFPSHEVNCCYEAGCCGYWIARRLQHLNWKVVVVNPADVPRTNKQDWQKTDKIDCRKLCEQLQKSNFAQHFCAGRRTGAVAQSFPPSKSFSETT